MGVKNEEFFKGKTYAEIFSELKFEKYLKNLEKKLKDKRIAIYGAGIMFDHIADNFDLSGFNIVAVSDRRFEVRPKKEHKGIAAISPQEFAKRKDIDVILITTLYPVGLRGYLKKVVYEGLKMPRVYFILNKPFRLYWEEIFGV